MKPVKLYALLDEKGKVIKVHDTMYDVLYVYTSRQRADEVRRYLIRYKDYKQIKIVKLEELSE